MNNNGFRLPEAETAVLRNFPEPFKGAEVRVKLDVDIGIYVKMEDLRAAEKFWNVVKLFTEEVLLDWNVQDRKGKELSPDWKGVQKAPQRFLSMVINNWMEAVTDVPAPLDEPSSDGLGLAEASTVQREGQSENPGG